MKLSGVTVSMAAVAALAGSIALWPANAQPADQPPVKPAPSATRPAGPRGGDGASEWREKLRDEVREHPRLGRTLVALHEAKDYLEKTPSDFGGHKATSMKACDDAIKEIGEALKFDEKRDPGAARPGRPGRGRGGEPKPADAPAPADSK